VVCGEAAQGIELDLARSRSGGLIGLAVAGGGGGCDSDINDVMVRRSRISS